ncbi:hypothetical protein [Paraburkholderia aromaticivorans]|uniref:hypothetical protein n=1 Tax=Paraburkholderia aromaticivorans TaxID=2026199 RepID=UPI0014560FCC|nr:hypothetical protein [Paraburkholderia aromaticivorans]
MTTTQHAIERASQAAFDVSQAHARLAALEADNTKRGNTCTLICNEHAQKRAWGAAQADLDALEAGLRAEVVAINANKAEIENLNRVEIPRLNTQSFAMQVAAVSASNRSAEVEFEAATLAWLDVIGGEVGAAAKRLQDAYKAIGKTSGLRLDHTPVSAVSAA